MNWEEIKKKGSAHYKIGSIEPIDLFKSGGILWDWCLGEIIAKAYRNRGQTFEMFDPKVTEDLDEIIHYAEMLKCCAEEGVENAEELTRFTKKTTCEMLNMPTSRCRVGTKSNRRRP